MELLKDFFLLLKDFQGLIGVLIGVWIASLTSKKERTQKEIITESERIDKFRLSAISERLAAHQKAFKFGTTFHLIYTLKKKLKLI